MMLPDTSRDWSGPYGQRVILGNEAYLSFFRYEVLAAVHILHRLFLCKKIFSILQKMVENSLSFYQRAK